MKPTLKLAGICLAGSLLVGVAFALVLQGQALRRARQENRLLHQHLDNLTAQADQLGAEKERLLKVIAAQQANAGAPLAGDQSGELLRLRGEVGRSRLVDREVEQSRRDQMQAAQAKLTNAEAQVARLTELYSEKLVSAQELDEAKFALELLKAEAKGDSAEAAQIRLRHAEVQLARLAKLRSQSLISQTEYDEAVRRAESLRTGTEP
jgi:hypothetical protein